ncbi:hypothetical protein GOBAR_DD17907 [Gossypium barbadense]|nr:hypothetical protein GOBAR_DD17907 [Gossypium barbadense]
MAAPTSLSTNIPDWSKVLIAEYRERGGDGDVDERWPWWPEQGTNSGFLEKLSRLVEGRGKGEPKGGFQSELRCRNKVAGAMVMSNDDGGGIRAMPKVSPGGKV